MVKNLARAVLFVDGSNFYHGMKKAGISPKGLDYARFSQRLVGMREWVETRFYVGQLKQGDNPALYQGQRKFLQHMQKFEQLNIFLGRMESHPAKGAAQKLNRWLRRLPNHPNGMDIPRTVIEDLRNIAESNAHQWTEKAVDVMIATDMVSMAYQGLFDVAYLLSADGDFTPAVKEVRKAERKVFIASASPGYQLSQVANTFILLRKEHFYGCWE